MIEKRPILAVHGMGLFFCADLEKHHKMFKPPTIKIFFVTHRIIFQKTGQDKLLTLPTPSFFNG
jgi:hypothetical protein